MLIMSERVYKPCHEKIGNQPPSDIHGRRSARSLVPFSAFGGWFEQPYFAVGGCFTATPITGQEVRLNQA